MRIVFRVHLKGEKIINLLFIFCLYIGVDLGSFISGYFFGIIGNSKTLFDLIIEAFVFYIS